MKFKNSSIINLKSRELRMNEKNTDEVASFDAETEVPSTPITEASLTLNEPAP